jgi:hypothetical protein
MSGTNPNTPYYPLNAEEITASDVTVFSAPSAIYVGTGGNVSVVTAEGNTVTFTNVIGGTTLPVLCSKVRATSTTGSGFVRVY